MTWSADNQFKFFLLARLCITRFNHIPCLSHVHLDLCISLIVPVFWSTCSFVPHVPPLSKNRHTWGPPMSDRFRTKLWERAECIISHPHFFFSFHGYCHRRAHFSIHTSIIILCRVLGVRGCLCDASRTLARSKWSPELIPALYHPKTLQILKWQPLPPPRRGLVITEG